MEDSSEFPNSNEVAINIDNYENGYLLTLTPDKNWLNDEEIVYPVSIYPEVSINNNAFTFYISESNSGTQYTDNYLNIGGKSSTGSRYESIIYFPNLLSNITDMTAVKEAKLNIAFALNSFSGNNQPIEICSINNRFMYPFWNSCGGNNISNTYISELKLPEYTTGVKSFDITKSIQTHLNYIRSGSYTGSYCYGFKLRTADSDNTDSRLFLAFSERSTQTAPYFEITYLTNSAYTMAYTPDKFNDITSSDHTNSTPLYNFQNKMNCYAYALQVYNRNSKSYSLLPGEFGLSNSTSITNNRSTLRYYYEGTVYHLDTNQQRLDFIDKNMREDAKALNFTISQPFKKQNGKFVLPSNFNESSSRIIALTTAMYFGLCEYHYYVRNGNGTCLEHGGNCSMWSHKPAHGSVTNESFSDGTVLCDNNIANYIGDNNGKVTYSSDANYYVITKDTNLYNSWHGDGGSGGTPYRP